MAAADYVLATKDLPWLERNYVSIRNWADKMIEFDRDGDGLMEYAFSGNSWTGATRGAPPSNWWDTINFGHKDAYSNALAYPAFLRMAELSRIAGRTGDANKYAQRAEKLKSVYCETGMVDFTGTRACWWTDI
jgi:uncharacterized protein (DUF608 family)